jgi:2-polyprenyl-6-methoxyphenol hydroxylase-like FAD-dependent oxidoreductase
MYDAIVVGARCAGSPTGMLLARKGYKVLVVDRSTFPSDTLSTHVMAGDSVFRLHTWGLLDRVMATGPTNCKPGLVFWIDQVSYEVQFPPSPLPRIAPRRTYLDNILVQAAREAGAEVRQGVSMQELLLEDGKVVGIRAQTAQGGELFEERARIVIGADGRNSHVAKAVGAQEYNHLPPRICAYYAYYSGVKEADRIEFHNNTGGPAVAIFPTNDNQVCLAVIWPIDQWDACKKDPEKAIEAACAGLPELTDRLKDKKREERVMGWGGYTSFYRKPYGPGWALLGDAGYLKDSTLGQGINDCFRDADLLSEALDAAWSGREELDAALAAYQQRRDAETGGIYALNDLLSQGITKEKVAILQQAITMAAAAAAGQ